MTIREHLEVIRKMAHGMPCGDYTVWKHAVAAIQALNEAEVERSWEYPHRVEFRIIPDPESSEIAENET